MEVNKRGHLSPHPFFLLGQGGGGPTYTPTQGSIYWKIPPPGGGGEYQPMSFGGKNMKRRREKGGKCKRKSKKGKRKRKKGERK
jgi:hypothetical protein